MIYYIYLTTNLINGKKYIGQHKGDIDDSYLGSGILISTAIKKYGKQNFKKEILQICSSREEADELEKYYINLYNAVLDENFYNLQEGGTGGDGWRACHRWLKNHPNEAKKIYQQNVKKLQQWQKDHPEERYEKIIKPMLEGSKKWKENHPEEVAALMKKVNYAKEQWQKEHPEEYQRQVEEWRKKGSEVNSQKVKCITTDKIFNSQSEAARFYNIPQGNISKCLKGERKSAGKHPETGKKLQWKLID